MSSLADILVAGQPPGPLVATLAQAMEAHIQAKGGLKGMAMKTGYNLMRSAKPDLAERAVRGLLPDILAALEPTYQQFRKTGAADFGSFLQLRAAEAVPAVTAAVQRRFEASSNPAAQKLYKQFSGSVADDLKTLLPSFGRSISAHLDTARRASL